MIHDIVVSSDQSSGLQAAPTEYHSWILMDPEFDQDGIQMKTRFIKI